MVSRRVEFIACIDLLAQLFVLAAVRLGLGEHPLDLALIEVRLFADGDALLGARVLVACGDMQDPVGIDVEGDLDLWLTARGRSDVLQLEPAEYAIILGHLAFALQHNDIHGRLVVCGGGEHLAAPGRDGGVALDDLGHHAAGGLHTQREWGDVEQQDVGDLALEHARLDGGAQRDHLVRVDGHVRVLAAGEPADQGLDGGDAGRPADQDDLVDVVGASPWRRPSPA